MSRSSTDQSNDNSVHIDSDYSDEERSDNWSSDNDDERSKSDSGKTLTLDRISLLPDSVLIHILSLLPIEEIIRTGILSKRWQYLWTFSPNLLFIDHKNSSPTSNFVQFVDQTLVLCGASKIRRFMIDFDYSPSYDSKVHSWVRFAMKNNAEELTLHLHDTHWGYRNHRFGYYKLPQYLYTKSRLTKLSLSYCHFEPKGVICWRSLKSLSIGNGKLSNDVIERILSGSPVLEYLELHHFQGIDSLSITSVLLKKLVIRGYDYNEELGIVGEDDGNEANDMLEISCPNLHSLDILGCFCGTNCRIRDVASLVKANLNFSLETFDGDDVNHEECRNTLKELLESLHHVENLTIGTWCIQALITFEKVGLHLPLSTRKCLKLDTRIKKRDLYGIVNLLGSSPDLQTLIINMDPPCKSKIFRGISLSDIPEPTMTKCLCLHLKTIKIINFVEGNCVFELLQFLLKNEVLEKMIISAPREGDNSSRVLFRATKKLLSLPRASPRAVILFSK